MERRVLAWRGATLSERIAFLRSRGTSGSVESASLARWAQACARGDGDACLRRLEWDGIEPALAASALAVVPPPDFPDSPWTAVLVEYLDEAAACARGATGQDWRRELEAARGLRVPFVEAWIPLLRVARRRLPLAGADLRRWCDPEAVAGIEAQLLRTAAGIGELAVFDDFGRARAGDTAGGRGVYRRYVARLLESGLAGVLDRFPVLARQLVTVAGQWASEAIALGDRLARDRDDIERTFGREARRVARVAPGLSDRHASGRSVCRVEFASGLCLAYKPRSVGVEAAFHHLLEWLGRAGMPHVPLAPRVMDRGDYGWVEWVEQARFGAREGVRDYFRSAGVLACLTHVLGGTDLHAENVVATVRGPVLVDTEMLLQPGSATLPAFGARGSEVDPIASASCLAPGLVTLVTVAADGVPFDVGGLQHAAARSTVIASRRWLNLGRSSVAHVATRVVRPSLSNDVRLRGRVQRPEAFAADLRLGFEEAYRFLVSSRDRLLHESGPLSRFGGCPVRVLFRPSDQYGALQYLLAAPRYQRDGADRGLAIETLLRVFARERERPALWPLVADERDQLERLDIPRLSILSTACDLAASSGETVRGVFGESGLDAVRRRLRALGDDDLVYQLHELRSALRPVAVRRGGGDGRGPAPAAVASIADEVLASAATPSGHPRRWPACRDRFDLYAGHAGIALFLAAMARQTGGDSWRVTALEAVEAVRSALASAPPSLPRRPGACSGLPSVAYAFALAGCLLDEPALFAEGLELVRGFPADAIDEDRVLDVEGGVAGTLIVLTALDPEAADPAVRGLAARCARRLLATQLEGGPDDGAWPAGSDSRARPGFAHGAAGIACALARWSAVDRDPAYRASVARAWAYERRVFAQNGGTWPATRGDGSRIAMAAWCHGAPGIGLARATAPATIADAQVPAEIDAAMAQTMAAPPGQLDHLCCGNLGRADALLTGGMACGRQDWIDAARGIAAAVAGRVTGQGRLGMRAQGVLRRAPEPGFFQGLAGIGYQLLRVAEPDVFPSVLAFEPPSHQRRHISR